MRFKWEILFSDPLDPQSLAVQSVGVLIGSPCSIVGKLPWAIGVRLRSIPWSIYGYFVCHDCRQMLWLGKAIQEEGHVQYFHIGTKDEPPNWNREILSQVIWKLLADHCGHRINVNLENNMTEEMFGYQDLDSNGGEENGVSFESYLEGWLGLRSPAEH